MDINKKMKHVHDLNDDSYYVTLSLCKVNDLYCKIMLSYKIITQTMRVYDGQELMSSTLRFY